MNWLHRGNNPIVPNIIPAQLLNVHKNMVNCNHMNLSGFHCFIFTEFNKMFYEIFNEFGKYLFIFSEFIFNKSMMLPDHIKIRSKIQLNSPEHTQNQTIFFYLTQIKHYRFRKLFHWINEYKHKHGDYFDFKYIFLANVQSIYIYKCIYRWCSFPGKLRLFKDVKRY